MELVLSRDGYFVPNPEERRFRDATWKGEETNV